MRPELSFLIVGFFWGVTNPFIKKGSHGIEKVKKNNPFIQFFAEAKFLVLNFSYIIPFLIANCGSLLYYVTLQSADLTIAVPLTNSVAFLFTAITGGLLGEQQPDISILVFQNTTRLIFVELNGALEINQLLRYSPVKECGIKISLGK